MQVPSLRFFVFFVARSGVAFWTPFLIIFGPILAPFWGPKINYFGVIFWTPKKVGSKSEKEPQGGGGAGGKLAGSDSGGSLIPFQEGKPRKFSIRESSI